MTQAAQQPQQQGLLFLPSLFHETMDIIFESYEFFQLQEDLNKDHLSPYMQAVYSHEMSRITMRLTSVMAWLMARKAISCGQIGDDEADMHYRLDAVEECLAQNLAMESYMPLYMKDLLDRSLHLFERVHRLDQQLDQPHTTH